jgi:hypothetical protein
MLGYDKLTAIAVVRATTETGHADDTVRVGSTPGGAYRNDVPFSMELDAKPLRVELDPDGDLLKMRKLPVKLGSLRDPDDGMLVLGTGGGGEVSPERLRELAAEDSVTLVRYGWSVRLVPDTAVSLGDLQRRRVFLYGDSSSNSILPGFLDRFPKRLDRGEFLEARKSADDLVLIQAIENPHNNYGTAVWICPSGPASPAALKPVDRSWALMRGEEEVVGGTWDAVDPNLVVEIPR